MIRPTPATWFEILSAKDDTTRLLETLAGAGCAEFEPAMTRSAVDPRSETLRQRFFELDRRYRSVWPKITATPAPHASPATVLARAVEKIERWATAAEPELAARATLQTELAALEQWQRLLTAPEIGPDERAALAKGDRNRLFSSALFTGEQISAAAAPATLIVRPLSVAGEPCLLALGSAAALDEFADQLALAGGRRIEAVDEIAASDPQTALASRAQYCRENIAQITTRLDAIAAQHDIAGAVTEAEQGCWCLASVASVETRQALCSVTGWTANAPALARTIDASGAPALVRFGPPPSGLRAPMLLHNPWWVSPYEIFSRLVGMPDRNAADPSLVVAIAFPLIFGYMFGDLGQGLLLACGGLIFGKRWPLARLLIPGGISAAFFGLIFGCVFSMHDVLPPLWADPLTDPLRVLLVPLFGGAVLLLAGLTLAATAARWRGELSAWLRSDGAAAAVYGGVTVGFFSAAGFVFAIAIALLATFLEMRQADRNHAFAAGAAAIATIIEKAFQLAINTLSFVRIGAFAIAHAGLSAALSMLATDAGGAAPLVIVIGNLFIIALEVLVVSVQTTRLLLFEFFTRFFTGTGRAFQPAPPFKDKESRHES
jgi:V/A-type H+-transporting ATPase subunit I